MKTAVVFSTILVMVFARPQRFGGGGGVADEAPQPVSNYTVGYIF